MMSVICAQAVSLDDMKREVREYKLRNRDTWVQDLMDADLHKAHNPKKALFLRHILRTNKKRKREREAVTKGPTRTPVPATAARAPTTTTDPGRNARYAYLTAQFTPFVLALRQHNLTNLEPEDMCTPAVFDSMSRIAELQWTRERRFGASSHRPKSIEDNRIRQIRSEVSQRKRERQAEHAQALGDTDPQKKKKKKNRLKNPKKKRKMKTKKKKKNKKTTTQKAKGGGVVSTVVRPKVVTQKTKTNKTTQKAKGGGVVSTVVRPKVVDHRCHVCHLIVRSMGSSMGKNLDRNCPHCTANNWSEDEYGSRPEPKRPDLNRVTKQTQKLDPGDAVLLTNRDGVCIEGWIFTVQVNERRKNRRSLSRGCDSTSDIWKYTIVKGPIEDPLDWETFTFPSREYALYTLTRRITAPDLKLTLNRGGFYDLKFNKDKSLDRVYNSAMESRETDTVVAKKFGTFLTAKDLKCLAAGKWINGSTMEYYCHLLIQDFNCEHNSVHIMSTYFYQRLTSKFDTTKKDGRIINCCSDEDESDEGAGEDKTPVILLLGVIHHNDYHLQPSAPLEQWMKSGGKMDSDEMRVWSLQSRFAKEGCVVVSISKNHSKCEMHLQANFRQGRCWDDIWTKLANNNMVRPPP